MGGSTIANSETKIEALKLQSSAYGVTVPVVGGVNRIAGNLIDYDDFLATPHTTTDAQGGKGGGVKTQSNTFSYSASVIMGICQGPIGAISRIWKGKEVFDGGWSPANIAAATETYTPPGSGAMTYTPAHAATMLGAPRISFVTTDTTWSQDGARTRDRTVQLAESTDYSLAGGVITINASLAHLRGVPLTVGYQWGSGAPDLAPLVQLDISLANGDMGQTAPAWMTASHPTKALGYPGLAYVHGQAYQLGSGAQVENHSFEVQGAGAYRYGSGQPDCNPWEFAAGVMSNGRYGARMPADTIDSEAAIAYVAAAGLLMSPLLTEQVRAGDFIAELCRFTNCAPVWSFDRLRIVPYGDTTITGNSVTYTPNVTPLYDLDDDHWLQEGADDPLTWQIKEPSDRYNHVRVEFCDRANYYNKTIAEAKDDADIAVNGQRSMDTINAPWICDAAVAAQVARIIQQRSLNITGTGTIKLPWAYCLLECMDLITITDPGLGFDHLPVRITSIGEDEDGTLSVEVEDWPLGSAQATRYPNQVAAGYLHDYNVSPGSVQPPVIFELPGALTQNGLEIGVAATGLGATWGGFRLWVSLDGLNYKQAAVNYGGSRCGTLTAAASAGEMVPFDGGLLYGGTPYGALTAPDGVDGTVAVVLLRGTLTSGTAADAAALATLCYIGGASPEFIAYETATLTSALHYSLAGSMVRGAYGTPAAPHASGAPFVRVDDAIATSGVLDLGYVGRTIHLKLTSFNFYGVAEESLADVPAYTYTVTGAQVYGNAGAQALVGLAAAASDGVLTAGEKPPVVLDVAAITSEQAGIDAQASATGFATPCATAKAAYDAAVSALTTYLGTLTTPTAWNVLTGDTTIVGATFRTKFGDVYATRQALLNAIAATAATMAAWGNVSGVSVTTGQIATGAVSPIAHADQGAGSTTLYLTEETLLTASIDSGGAPIYVSASVSAHGGYSARTSTFGLKVDGTAVYSKEVTSSGDPSTTGNQWDVTGAVLQWVIAAPASGARSITLTAVGSDAVYGVNATKCNLYVEAKKR